MLNVNWYLFFYFFKDYLKYFFYFLDLPLFYFVWFCSDEKKIKIKLDIFFFRKDQVIPHLQSIEYSSSMNYLRSCTVSPTLKSI